LQLVFAFCFDLPFEIKQFVCHLILFQHEISIAADNGVRQLIEETDGDATDSDKAAAMKSAVEKKISALRLKMGKLVAVAHPDLTDGWLREVMYLFLLFVILM